MTERTVGSIVADDLCIGCGLCESITNGRVTMAMSPAGSLRPTPIDGFSPSEEARIIDVCPGVVAEERPRLDVAPDPIWGRSTKMIHAWAGDPEIRFRSATGGALTALATHLLETKKAAFVLHVGPDPEAPMRSIAVVSESLEQVLANAGSRYGPTAALASFNEALDRGERFAVIAKPCDLGAIHRLSRHDSRVDDLVVVRLTMVCGGQSRLTKSTGVLESFGIAEREVSLFRYRGFGNPGPTRVETTNGRVEELSYLDMWADESSWNIETRCKLCPDPLGEAADIAAADVWPGGAPSGDDEGFNGLIVRSVVGDQLVIDAVAAGNLVLGDPITPRQFDDFQPHQVRKKHALAARYAGMADAGVEPISTHGLRVEELGLSLSAEQTAAEREGAAVRLRNLRDQTS